MLHRKKPGEIFSLQRCHLTKKGVLADVTKVIPLPRDWVGARNIMLRALRATAVVFQELSSKTMRYFFNLRKAFISFVQV